MSLQVILDGDISFVKGWQKGYGATDPLTGIAYPGNTPYQALYEPFEERRVQAGL